jgi:hypothetical protein
VNWTASSAGAGVAGVAGIEAAPLAQDEAAADDAPAGLEPVGADVPDPPPAAAPAAPDELDEAVAQPAARPAAASATSVENTVREVINGISFVTFQMTLYRPARLYRPPAV